jgi:hypothetical protein
MAVFMVERLLPSVSNASSRLMAGAATIVVALFFVGVVIYLQIHSDLKRERSLRHRFPGALVFTVPLTTDLVGAIQGLDQDEIDVPVKNATLRMTAVVERSGLQLWAGKRAPRLVAAAPRSAIVEIISGPQAVSTSGITTSSSRIAIVVRKDVEATEIPLIPTVVSIGGFYPMLPARWHKLDSAIRATLRG